MTKEKPKLFSKDYQKEWSEKYSYKHIHTGEHCTFEAYVAELIVLRRAEKMNLPKPSYKFWTKGDPNHWLWMKQFNAARALKKKYGEKAILEAIKSKDFDRLLVLGIQNGRGWKINPSAEKVVAKYHKAKEEGKSEPLDQPEKISTDKEAVVRKAKSTNNKKVSTFNKLRNL